MKKFLIVGLGLLSVTGLGFCLYKIGKNATESQTTRKPAKKEAAETINEEVGMATKRAAYYAATKQLEEMNVEAIEESSTSFENVVDTLKSVEIDDSIRFYSRKFNRVGFAVHTRYGNVVVWNDLNSDDDSFEFSSPDRVLSLLPQVPEENFKYYLEIGKSIEKIVGGA